MSIQAIWGAMMTSSASDPTSWASMPAAEGTTVVAPDATIRAIGQAAHPFAGVDSLHAGKLGMQHFAEES